MTPIDVSAPGRSDAPASARPAMTREFSLYLDLVRFVASFLVFISHTNDRVLSATPIPMSSYGHSSVVVFFVLSGFVIAYITGTKERIWQEYTVSRMARIYSVAFPALLLTVAVDTLGGYIDPDLYAGYTTHDLGVLRFASSMLFLNEFWGISITAFSNVPYWSLCYEVWYYALFGVLMFWRLPGRTWAILAVALLAGPKVLLLFPLWWMGVALYRNPIGARLSPRAGVVLFVLSFALIFAFHWANVPGTLFDFLKSQVGETFHTNMTWSRYVLSDYMLGVLVVMNFVGFRAAQSLLGGALNRFSKPIRWAASFTLSVYLFHRPLVNFYTALIDGNPQAHWFWFSTATATLVTCIALGYLTEHRKDDYKRVFAGFIRVVETRGVRLVTAWADRKA